jgi:hypothetical protein
MCLSYHPFVKNSVLLIVIGFTGSPVLAQKDTTKKQTVNIISSFKPVLRNAVKINFSGSQLPADTSKTVRSYSIPSQNLFYAYQPISLKPLALQQDTFIYLGDRNYLKAGFGSYSTPYLEAGLGFGDGKTAFVNLYGNYIASKGNIKNQDFSILSLKSAGSYFLPKNEVYASAELSRKQYFKYGYDHSLYDYTKDQIRQQFQEIDVMAGFRNTRKTATGFNYNPSVRLNFFTNKDQLSETTVMIDAPVDRSFGDDLTVKVELNADLTNYATKNLVPDNLQYTNNVIKVAPSVIYNSGNRFMLNAGIIPAWDNGYLSYLPNIYGEFQVKEKIFMLQGGWVGRIHKNTYRNLSRLNPYLGSVIYPANTRETELYGGIKASIGDHFNFSAKAGFITYRNYQFFINDTTAQTDSKTFLLSQDSKVNNLRLHGDLSYINQDKFTFTAGVTFNGYTGMKDNVKAWNTVPMEFTSSLRWWAFERLLLKGDFYFFGGGNYLEKGGISRSFNGGSDLSAGAEYKINKQFSAFLDVNNIFDNSYERWHNYPVYGLGLLGGIIVRF